MITNSLITVAILVTLSITSIWFNRYIDNLPPGEQPDGETSNQVVVGVMYTLVGAAGIIAVWFGLELALRIGSVFLVAFMASGWPMIRGDRNRQRSNRTVYEAKLAAKYAQDRARRVLEDCYDE